MTPEQEKLVLSNTALVANIAATLHIYPTPGLGWDDHLGAGMVGLVEAARSYQPRKGIKFATYAYYRIRGAIFDQIRENSSLPRSMIDAFKLLDQLQEDLVGVLGRMPTLDEISSISGIDSTVIHSWVNQAIPLSLDASCDAGDGEMGDTVLEVAGVSTPSAEEDYFHSPDYLSSVLDDCLARVPQKPREALLLNIVDEIPLKTIGKRRGVTESRACQDKGKALKLAREFMQARGLACCDVI